ncbi:MAG: baseplate J/gp47 family protein, partial [Byssovorax sp.]
MAVALSDLVKDLTREQVLEDLLAIATALGLSTTAWQPGEPVWVLLTTMAEQLSKLWNTVIVRAIRAGFLDYAEGGWLTLLAWTMYGVFRKDASFGTALITLENRGGGFYPIAAGDVRIANDASKTFVNTTAGSLASWTGTGPYPTVALQFVADEAGAGSSTAIGGILAYPNEPPTAFAGVYARTNTAALVGADVEDDDSLRARCRLST